MFTKRRGESVTLETKLEALKRPEGELKAMDIGKALKFVTYNCNNNLWGLCI